VKFARGQTHIVKGKGTTKFVTSSGIKKINEVLYVPVLTKNLLSIESITNKGHVFVFDSNKCLVILKHDPKAIVAKGLQNNSIGLYKMNHIKQHKMSAMKAPTKNREISLTSIKNESEMKFWHQRLGHLGSQNMQSLSKHKLVDGVPTVKAISEM
jgi:hypothetical protein